MHLLGISHMYESVFIFNLLFFTEWEWYYLDLSLRPVTAPSQNLSLCQLCLFTSLTAISATPSPTVASSTMCQLLTHRTNQELFQRASEFPITVPCQHSYRYLPCHCPHAHSVAGSGHPLSLIFLRWQLRKAELSEAGLQGLWTVLQDLVTGTFVSTLSLKDKH